MGGADDKREHHWMKVGPESSRRLQTAKFPGFLRRALGRAVQVQKEEKEAKIVARAKQSPKVGSHEPMHASITT